MTGQVSAVRLALAAVLEAAVTVDDRELTVLSRLPDRWAPPGVLLEPGDPFITRPDDVSSWLADYHFDVILIPRAATNPVQGDALERMVEQTIDALLDDAHDWLVEQVSAPFRLAINPETSYLAQRVTVALLAPIRTTTEE